MPMPIDKTRRIFPKVHGYLSGISAHKKIVENETRTKTELIKPFNLFCTLVNNVNDNSRFFHINSINIYWP
jgi:hypothetical protein